MSEQNSNLVRPGDNPIMASTKSNAEQENSQECLEGVFQPKQICAIQSGGSITARDININSNPRNNVIHLFGPYLFMLKDSIEPFTGRIDILKRMHKAIQVNQQKLKPTVLSQVLAIVGGEAVGKTEVTRKYANDGKDFYRHILWINAETHDKAKSCFLQVASQIDVLVSFGGKQKQLDFILEEIDDNLCRERCLIVFDNVNSMEGKDGIQPFLPKTIKPNWKHPAILITSRNLNWGNIPVIPLDHWKQQRDRSTVPSSNPAIPRPSTKTNGEQGITNPRLIILLVVGLGVVIISLVFFYMKSERDRKAREAREFREATEAWKASFRNLLTYIFGAASALSVALAGILSNMVLSIYGGFLAVVAFIVHRHR